LKSSNQNISLIKKCKDRLKKINLINHISENIDLIKYFVNLIDESKIILEKYDIATLR
jgi:hypothetical protein